MALLDVYIWVCTVLAVIGFTSNVVVLVVMFNFKKRLLSMDYCKFLTNQSIIDGLANIVFLVKVQNVKLVNTAYTKGNIVDELICHLWFSETYLYIFLDISTLNLVVTVVEKYIKLVHSIWHRSNFTSRIRKSMLALPWILGLASSALYALKPITEPDQKQCYYKSPSRFYAITVAWKSIAFYCTPIIIFIVCYYGIVKSLRQPNRTTGSICSISSIARAESSTRHSTPAPTLDDSANTSSMRSTTTRGRLGGAQRRILRTLYTVVLLFIICWTANYMEWFLRRVMGIESQLLLYIAEICALLNVAANPFVYVAQFKRFRDCLKELITSIAQCLIRLFH